ncbi:MAG: signal peptide peptidase SppA [Ignavibacteriae bacterium]|nr:signal peptide peptidase SppA [Ignavibacteria bacterium]MBI3364875.1 signal peptide peptidase SppA [Ignavibacteriota bacterium]
MNTSTKWFIGIVAFIIFIGVGFSLLFVTFVSSVVREDVEVVSEGGRGDKIAVVELAGVIVTSEETVRQIKKYREDRSIKAILFRVDSPGGGVVASQEIYQEVRKTRDDGKPIVVSMGALAASGGYYVSCGASTIVANPGTLTGSIGVISQFMSVDSLLHKIGVTPNTIKSGKLKDAGSPFRPMTSEDRAYFQSLMDDVHRQFIDVVEKERDLDHDTVVAFADGRVFTGEQALDLGLVDTLGTYEDAIHIAAHLAHIKGEPTLVKERKRGVSLFERIFGETKIPDFLGLKDELLNQPILQYRMTHGL